MSQASSGFPLPSRDAQEFPPGPSWQQSRPEQPDFRSKTSLALTILREKIKSGALQRTELMQRIVQQAAAATGAKGVALALRREADGMVVCCAATGDMAPPPGTVLDQRSGFTAECLRHGTVLICEDSENDSRVDQDACARLGVRSIVAAPVDADGPALGVLEALSDQQAAFTKQHIEILLTLACFAKSAIAPAAQIEDIFPRELPVPVPEKDHAAPIVELASVTKDSISAEVGESLSWSERVPRRVRMAIAAGVAAAFLLAIFATGVFAWMWHRGSEPQAQKSQTSSAPQSAVAKPPAAIGASLLLANSRTRDTQRENAHKPPLSKASQVEKVPADEETPVAVQPERPSVPSQENAVAPAGMSPPEAAQVAELGSVLSMPASLPTPALPKFEGVTSARLQHRVEPQYPQEAKRLRIEGAVVLRAAIDAEGKVSSVGVVNGNPILAQAAMAAVRQWRYQPSQLNHHPAASTTDITIVFHLQ